MKINYQKILDKTLDEIRNLDKTPSLLIHSCCAPCSSYVLEYLSEFFNITILFYNPNIHPESEYIQRLEELHSFIGEFPAKNPIKYINLEYDPNDFFESVKGLEDIPEGGERCFNCYELRLRKTAEYAKEYGFDYFTTALSISPHKNAAKINELGEALSNEYDVNFLYADFKKKGGFKRSIELSDEYNLYRQDYCGCVYSKQEAQKRIQR